MPAVTLFIERATAGQPAFALTAENAAATVAIAAASTACRWPSSWPRRGSIPPADHTAGRLSLLTGGARDLPARQQTMRDAIAWSYDLLAPAEQALFRRLAVFAGGFTLAAAEAVADAEALLVLDGVIALVEQSLLRQMPAPVNRATRCSRPCASSGSSNWRQPGKQTTRDSGMRTTF